MYAVYQVAFDVPFAEEAHQWLGELPWAVWAVAGGLLYLVGFRAAGRFVAGLASTPGGRVAGALAWPVVLALFPVCKAVAAVGRTVVAPLVRWLDPAKGAPPRPFAPELTKAEYQLWRDLGRRPMGPEAQAEWNKDRDRKQA